MRRHDITDHVVPNKSRGTQWYSCCGSGGAYVGGGIQFHNSRRRVYFVLVELLNEQLKEWHFVLYPSRTRRS